MFYTDICIFIELWSGAQHKAAITLTLSMCQITQEHFVASTLQVFLNSEVKASLLELLI